MKKPAALLFAGLVFLAAADIHSQDAASPAPSPPPDKTEELKIKPGQDFITLNFTNIDIAALVKVMSELTRRNFIIDEKVTGKVTLMTPTKISADEAYQVFLSALEIKGFTAVEDGKITRIVSTTAVRQSGLKVVPDGDFKGEGYVTRLMRLTYVNPQDIMRTLSPLITKDGNMIAYSATNSLIITDSVHNIRKIESLIRALDIPAPEGKGKINVYFLKNANAEDFAKVMSALVSRLPLPPAGGAAQPAGPSTILEGQVTITADKATNSLIIVASPGDYETIRDVIQKLDIRRRQVYVEAAIIEMSLAKQRELGFEFQASNLNNLNNSTVQGIGGTNFGNIGNVMVGGPAGLATLNGLNVGAVKGTFTFKGVEYLNIGALLHALQTDSDVNVLSTPNILTTDNQKAEIMVGQNVPFPTGQTQNAITGTGSVFNTIERKDVGIKLTLTPQIASDDNVRLEVNQEISDVVTSSSVNVNGLITNKRSASTTVVVKDRQTMVIGGLIRDNVVSSTSKVPLLGDIPILGWLFKFKTTRVEKTNLMIFITPYIIKNEGDASEITTRKGEALEEFRKEYRIEKKDGFSSHPSRTEKGSAGAVEETDKGKERAEPKDQEAVPAPAPVKQGETPPSEKKAPDAPPSSEKSQTPAEGTR